LEAIIISDVVIILGAGASFESKAPVMNGFFDKAEDISLYESNKLTSSAIESFKLVFNLIADLEGVYSKSNINLNNIEAVFGAIEMGLIIGRLGNITSKEEILKLKEALITLIVRTLDLSIRYPLKRVIKQHHALDSEYERYTLEPTESYRKFVDFIDKIQKKGLSCSVITFNYDIALDVALQRKNKGYSYCLYDTDRLFKDTVKLLKLHGSVNWIKEETDNIRAIDVDKLIPTDLRLFDDDPKEHRIILSNDIERMGESAFIVPPTWNKTGYYNPIQKIWSQAAKELSEARAIYTFGYSLPESDSFFRYLYALSTNSKTRLRRFWVFDPDSRVEDRYKSLIGRGTEDRFRFFDEKFSDALGRFIGTDSLFLTREVYE
jgi:hypothetical protein